MSKVKYSPEQNMKFIAEVANKYGYDPCFLIAKAKIESTLNNLAKNGKYAGLFQLSDGIGGISGDERYDPKKATEATIKYIEHNKNLFNKRFPGQFEPWMAYQMHQQGASGFMTIFASPNTKITDSTRAKAIKANSKKGWVINTHKDFMDKWRATFKELQNQCSTEYACFVSGSSGLSTNGACPLEPAKVDPIPSSHKQEARNQKIAIGLALATVAGLAIYKYRK